MQSYWNGQAWTGQSRPKPSLFARPGRAGGGEKGAFRWVLLALGLEIVASLVSPSGPATLLTWVLAAAATAAWLMAALKARSRLGSVILWVIFVAQAVGWTILLVAVGSGNISAASSPGADPELDRLWSECASQVFDSCDLLWLVGGSETGSRTEYEQFGGTCGGRTEYARDLCMYAFGSGPDIERWYSECETGDLGSCDLLATGIPMIADSSVRFDEEDANLRFGLTCGGRIDVEENIRGCLLQSGEPRGR